MPKLLTCNSAKNIALCLRDKDKVHDIVLPGELFISHARLLVMCRKVHMLDVVTRGGKCIYCVVLVSSKV